MPRRASAWQNLYSSRSLIGVVILVLFVAAVSFIGLKKRSEPLYQPTQLVDQTIVARVEFESIDIAKTERERDKARARVPSVFSPNREFLDVIRNSLQNLPKVLSGFRSIDQVSEGLKERYDLNEQTPFKKFANHLKGGQPTAEWQSMVSGLMQELKRMPIIEKDAYAREMQNVPAVITIVDESGDLHVPDSELISLMDSQALPTRASKWVSHFPPEAKPIVNYYLVTIRQPTYIYDHEATEARREAAARQVELVKRRYNVGDPLVVAGKKLSEDQYRILQEHAQAVRTSTIRSISQSDLFDDEDWLSNNEPLFERVGLISCVALLALALVGYIMAYRPRVATNPWRGLALMVLMLLTLTAAWGIDRFPSHATAVSAIGPALLLSIILAIAYDQRFALGVSAMYALLAGVTLGLSVPMVLVMLAVSMAAIVQLRELRNRSTLGLVGLISGLVAALGVWVAGLMDRMLIPGMMKVLAWESLVTLLGCIFIGFFILGVLPFIEKIFKVTTAMTLLEWGDMNRPLLRRMAQEAPGTFNHSLQVATLAETASESIGGNGLLARVGAYYHDIGKIHKPHYFVENQMGSTSLHDKLSPAMSLLIIVGHVKDGIEMAREYGIPPVLHHFIESHHGTTLVEYFYHAAKQKAEVDHPEEIEYRYPGPKPQTKEAAVLMLCDAVESASRAMAEPTAVRIEQLVHKLSTKRLMDGQFDECDITLSEIRTVERTITKSLTAIYHGRINYPTATEETPKAGPKAAAS
ncbi:MAG: HDIG domain-containing protein [Phycisphaeraceae bacterium]|nr:HDIG domain-containing protein [Phycisphaeraceae bacterium]